MTTPYPREAASRATPGPVMPPPITRTSHPCRSRSQSRSRSERGADMEASFDASLLPSRPSTSEATPGGPPRRISPLANRLNIIPKDRFPAPADEPAGGGPRRTSEGTGRKGGEYESVESPEEDGGKTPITVTVNGGTHRSEVEPRLLLGSFLREAPGL